MNRLPFLLLILSILTLPIQGESQREKRHASIRKRLEETSNLSFPYFAPSVHIRYQHPSKEQPYLAYYNEIQVKETFKHTYFCMIGFDVGYFGIQDHGTGPLAIFSVWDKGGGNNDSRSVDEADRTQVLFSNDKAKSSRFGGEGSGAKTMMPYAWKTDTTYSFLVSLEPQESGTIYTAWISEKGKTWEKIASYKTVVTKKELKSFYSFIEDYARTGETGQQRRLAYYPFQAAMDSKGLWQPIQDGSGTIADDVIQNGHSGVRDNRMYSQSGADTADYGSMPKDFRVERAGMPKDFPCLPGDFRRGGL